MTRDGPIRVVDLADDGGAFAGTLLAELGATVIKPEPPGGAPGRRIGPFVEREEQAVGATSLFHLHYHGGKQIVPIDPSGGTTLNDLLAGADLVLDDGSTGLLPAEIRPPDALIRAFPNLSVVWISSFGLTGPRAGWRGTDLTTWAAGGAMWLMGAPDRAPLWAAGQARHLTGFWAAIGALAAIRLHHQTGRGVIVDLSRQEAVAAETGAGWLFAAYAGQAVRRSGKETHFTCPSPILRCRDGHLLVMTVVRRQWSALAAWLAEEGAADGLDDPKYNDITVRMADRAHINDTLARWATISDAELEDKLAALSGERPSPETRTKARRLFAQVVDCPGGMKIQTIHAFCQSLLRRFPLEARLPPHF
ncbi:MAG TPA: CoA transferase, partial [Dehalococcoidia bacterium]|nr:CoA transferase [Dehalococcoidia bacterium]